MTDAPNGEQDLVASAGPERTSLSGRLRSLVMRSESQLAIGVAALAIAPGVAGVLAAQSLGPVGRGDLAVGIALSTIGGMLGLRGMDVAVLALGTDDAAGGLGSLRRLALRRGAGVLAVEGIAAGVLACLVVRRIDVLLAVLVAALAGATSLFVLLRAIALSARLVRAVMSADFVAASVLLTSAGLVRLATWPLEAYLTASLAGLVAGCAALSVAIRGPELPDDDHHALRAQLRAIGPAAWLARGLQTTAFRLDRVVLATIAGSGAAGIYAAIVPFAEMTTIIQLHLAQLATVQMSTEGSVSAWSVTREWRFARVMSVFLVLTMLLFAEGVIGLVYGPEYSDGALALRILAVASAVSVLWRFVEAELYARRRPFDALRATAAAAVTVTAATAGLAALGFGASGASIASLVGYALATAVAFARLRRARS